MGNITTRHQGGGHKQHYRIIDFRRNDKDGIPAKVERLEYDPNRSANIALVCYADGERRYMIAPKGIAVGQQIAQRRRGPDQVGQLAAAAQHPGGHDRALRRDDARQGRADRARGRRRRAAARPRGRVRAAAHALGRDPQVHINCRATIGEVGNEEHNLRVIGKAGANRWRGIRPTVRGVAMNPVDHPHGGGGPQAAGTAIRCRRGASPPRARRPAATSARRR